MDNHNTKNKYKLQECLTNALIVSIIIFMIGSLGTFIVLAFKHFFCTEPIGIRLSSLANCFVGSSAALLVYLAFNEQVKTNKKSDYLATCDRIKDLLGDASKLLDDFPEKGVDSLEYFNIGIKRNQLLLQNFGNPNIALNKVINLYTTLDLILYQIHELPKEELYTKILLNNFENTLADNTQNLSDICYSMFHYSYPNNPENEKIELLKNLTKQYGILVNKLKLKAF